eukprot:11578855-Alexandrium_andersonii.AAC.1
MNQLLAEWLCASTFGARNLAASSMISLRSCVPRRARKHTARTNHMQYYASIRALKPWLPSEHGKPEQTGSGTRNGH